MSHETYLYPDESAPTATVDALLAHLADGGLTFDREPGDPAAEVVRVVLEGGEVVLRLSQHDGVATCAVLETSSALDRPPAATVLDRFEALGWTVE